MKSYHLPAPDTFSMRRLAAMLKAMCACPGNEKSSTETCETVEGIVIQKMQKKTWQTE